MIYAKLYDEFVGLFPEDKAFFHAMEEKTGADKEDGMHVIFGMVVCPYIISLLSTNPEKAQKAFDFVEEMETSGDSDIVNVAEVSILEVIMTDEKGGIENMKKYMGKESLAAIEHMSQFFNLPQTTKTQ